MCKRNWLSPGAADGPVGPGPHGKRGVYPHHTRHVWWKMSLRLVALAMMMMMSFICSCRNKKEEPSSIYTLRKVRTIRGCLEGLTLMI